MFTILSGGAESDSVRLRACRAVRGPFSDMVNVTKYVGWESRLAVLEENAGREPDPGATYLGSRAAGQRWPGHDSPGRASGGTDRERRRVILSEAEIRD